MRKRLILLLGLALTACGQEQAANNNNNMDGSGGGTGDDGGTPIPTGSPMLTVSGQVVDFETGMPMSGSASVTTTGIMPPPTVSVTGADFVIDHVPGFSVFQLLASSPPDYRNTYNVAVSVESSDKVDIKAKVLKESGLAAYATAFAVTPTQGTAIVLVRAVDGTGAPLAGIPAKALTLTGAKGPYFLDANRKAAPALTATSVSGWAVFFDAPTGGATITAPAASGYTTQAGLAPTSAQTVTLTEAVVQVGMTTVTPANVSFSGKILPIFMARGCVNCHSGGGPGKDLGNLQLSSGGEHIYREITQEISPIHQTTRIDLKVPDKSLILTMPSLEAPADRHPTATFASPADPDYQLLLVWIKEGAKLN